MENLSHSRLPSKAAHASVAKRGCNVGNFAGKTVYEDVFGGPPKFGVPTLSPRPEDYREIFGGFHASRVTSIPVLDLPLVDEEEVFFDVRGCGFDYREVFGGVDGLDFATSFEELLKESNGGGDRHDCDGDVEGDSSEEAWTPVETESLSGESDRSGQNQQSSNGDSYEPIDSSLEFSISYHKVNHRSNGSFSNGVTRIAEPRLPEYTCVVDNSRPARKTENKNLPVYVCDDRSLDFTGQTMQERHLPKTMSNPAKRTADPRPFTDRLESHGSYGKVSSPYDEMFVTISEISLKTHPSEVPPPPRRPPPFLDGKRKDYENSQTTASGGTSGHSSPPYFDVEIDASSAAAASAAAMEEAMEKARAKMKSAKERMERKREGSQNGIKPGSKRDAKEKKEKLSKVVDGSKNVKDERVLGTSRKEDIAMKPPILQEGQEVAKTTEAVFNPLEREKAFNMAEMSADEKRGKQSVLSQGTDKIHLVDEWQEATQFFDLVRTDDSKMAFVQENNYSFSIDFENIKRNEHQLNASKEALQQQKENSQCREEAVREDHELDKVLRNLRTAKEACERGGNTARSEAAKGAHRRKEHEKKVKLAPAVGKLDESEVKSQIFQPLENGKKSARVEESHKLERQVTGKQEEHEVKSRIIQPSENGKKSARAERSQKVEKQVIGKQEENEVKSRIIQPLQKGKKSARAEGSQNLEKRVIGMQEENEVQPSFTQPLENGEKSARVEGSQNFEQVNAEEFQIQSEVQLGVNDFKYEHKEREASISMENQERSKECQETKDDESRQREVSERGEIDDIKVSLFGEQVDDVKSTEGACGEEDRADNTLMQTCELEGDEKKEEVDELDEGEMIWRMALEQLEKETRRKQAREQEEIQQKERKTCAEEANEIISEKVLEQENNEKTQKEVYEDDKRASKDDWDENDEMKRDLSKEQKECEELKEVNEVLWQIEDDSEGEVSNGAGAHQHMECEDQLASNGVYGLDSHVKHEFARTDESCDDQEEPETILIKDCSKVTDEDSDCESLDAREEDNLIWKFGFSRMDQDQLQFAASNLRMEEVTCLDHRENGVKKTDEAGISIGQRNAEKISSVLRTGSANEKLGKGERVENVKEVEAALKQEEEKNRFFPPPAVKESAEIGRKIDAAKSTLPEARGDTLRTAQPTKTNQSTEKKDNDVSLTAKEKEFERLKRERELEIERLRKMEEESEREREREKDRMAVDRVTLEARETAYADPRERVERAALERATAEARQRSTAEARERLEKATVEARLRAERAAVERATAEARERAFEKAKAERAAFEARQRIERSVSDKFSTYSRNSATGSSSFDQQNQQYKTTGSFNDSRNTSDYNGVEGESAQRCKARLERYRRTAERAANALAEKNMRDLLAQREQAERHRLAETLDADVRRWSNGKEGNLRALLSTLQYILGSESGWQPVPLTEVITSAAVKKAYRKATLCVHPDKLQQRGASIQQKYICEKVFDLLKEAWNKFNSEER